MFRKIKRINGIVSNCFYLRNFTPLVKHKRMDRRIKLIIEQFFSDDNNRERRTEIIIQIKLKQKLKLIESTNYSKG